MELKYKYIFLNVIYHSNVNLRGMICEFSSTEFWAEHDETWRALWDPDPPQAGWGFKQIGFVMHFSRQCDWSEPEPLGLNKVQTSSSTSCAHLFHTNCFLCEHSVSILVLSGPKLIFESPLISEFLCCTKWLLWDHDNVTCPDLTSFIPNIR